jgi:hypothetical protein
VSRRFNYLWVAAFGATLVAPLSAQPVSWDRVSNIETVGEQLAIFVKTKGADQAFEEIHECYKQNRGKKYSKDLETCLVKDIIHSQISAGVYSRVSKETRVRVGAPEPDAVLSAMTTRVVSTFRSHGIPEAQAIEFSKLVRERGFPAYGKGQRSQ